MPRLPQVRRLRALCGCGVDGADAVRGRNARRDALGRLDGDGERGGVAAGVVPGHQGELQRVDLLRSQAEAYDAAALPDQHGHLGNREAFGREDQIPFVLAVSVVRHQNAAACGERSDRGFDAGFGIPEALLQLRCHRASSSLSSGLSPSAPALHRNLRAPPRCAGGDARGLSRPKAGIPPVGTSTPFRDRNSPIQRRFPSPVNGENVPSSPATRGRDAAPSPTPSRAPASPQDGSRPAPGPC